MSDDGDDVPGEGAQGNEHIKPSRSASSLGSGSEGESNSSFQSYGDVEDEPGKQDEDWVMPVCPLLTDLCVKVIVDNFVTHPMLHALPRKYQEKVLALLPTTVPIAVTGPVVHDEAYWKRCCKDRWKNANVARHGSSWKRLFFETHCQEELESYNPTAKDISELLRTFVVAKDYVFCVDLKQLPSHLDIGVVLKQLGNVNQLRIAYNVRDVGMDFQWKLFGATLADVRNLSKAVSVSKELVVLALRSSSIDDDKARVLTMGLMDNHSITSLDLCHNKIGDRGARALAKYIGQDTSVVTALAVTDNRIGEAGGKALGKALSKNAVLLSLDLRLNSLTEGCADVCSGLEKNVTLTSLNLAGNRLTSAKCVDALHDLMRNNTSLTHLDISANKIGSKLGGKVQDGIEHNSHLTAFDFRLCEINKESEAGIEKVLERNLENAKEEAHYYEYDFAAPAATATPMKIEAKPGTPGPGSRPGTITGGPGTPSGGARPATPTRKSTMGGAMMRKAIAGAR